MVHPSSSHESAGLEEPRGITLADLTALVAGFALTFAMPWYGFQPGEVPWLRPALDWHWPYRVTATIEEGIERICLALTLVVLGRRIRYGGLVRPAEFLLP